ncbi:ribonuclease P protein subunit p29 [Plectosphaerella cucumerina]|jgi:ribonuclease P protein subunit POP4|uniref:Ribonuclease P protein subunit n=1 Tax=Plectosphaerella cucumerina TaxID=40658 RepID=A0A8K0TQJ6_9PEZI|nr:ribonuclease P protein subunit p29 [Plectosphaerella cucumerina]
MATNTDAAAATRSLLARAHSPTTVDRIYSEKIQFRNLYLRPSSPPPSQIATQKNQRDARRKAREDKKIRQKQRPGPLSSRKRRALGLHDAPRKGRKFAVYEPLHRLWLGYIREILGSDVYGGGQGAGAKLSAAEFHGAELEVSRSSCPSRVGIKGIVIKDAKHVFEIITRKNEVKIVPKEGTMFKVEVPVEKPSGEMDGEAASEQTAESTSRFVFEIHGDQLLLRGADRANKKYKVHFLKDV